MRLPWLGCLLIASSAVAPAQAAADDDPGFCSTIQDVVQASRTDFIRWRGKVRDAAPASYDATRALPRASDCRIEHASPETRYTCEWEYGENDEAAVRAAATKFLDAMLDCLGDKVQEVRAHAESKTDRRQTTALVVQGGADSGADLRVTSGLGPKNSTWYVEFSANRKAVNR
ncbi:MAG TPA: hypothetical protein VK548_15440 [Candidatus Acidoferrum sp.]|nr:hypothetical protein [Candidatus Acidoferrum sp.]